MAEAQPVRMADVRAANPTWFSRSYRRFFGDCSYKLLTAKNGQKYLVRLSAAWSDMFDGVKKYRYYLNPIKPDLSIDCLVESEGGLPKAFRDLDEVKEWLRERV